MVIKSYEESKIAYCHKTDRRLGKKQLSQNHRSGKVFVRRGCFEPVTEGPEGAIHKKFWEERDPGRGNVKDS